MSVGKRYVLDANAFIEASKGYYAFDICPGFWTALLRLHLAKQVFSIDKVKAELSATADDLSGWVSDRASDTFFKQTRDQHVADEFRNLVNWVQNEPQFTTDAKAEFASVADGWVVAYAKVNGLVVVTHEVFAPEAKRRVKIPNVCVEFDVDYCNTFEMLRDLRVSFMLKKRG